MEATLAGTSHSLSFVHNTRGRHGSLAAERSFSLGLLRKDMGQLEKAPHAYLLFETSTRYSKASRPSVTQRIANHNDAKPSPGRSIATCDSVRWHGLRRDCQEHCIKRTPDRASSWFKRLLCDGPRSEHGAARGCGLRRGRGRRSPKAGAKA